MSASIQRAMASPSSVLDGLAELERLDSIHVLPQIRVPTLVMARTGLAPGLSPARAYLGSHRARTLRRASRF